jgi:hypothetical protein
MGYSSAIWDTIQQYGIQFSSMGYSSAIWDTVLSEDLGSRYISVNSKPKNFVDRICR